MTGISQGVVPFAIERHVHFGVESDGTPKRNDRAYIVVIPVRTRADLSCSLVSSTSNYVDEGGPVTPDFYIFRIVCVHVNELVSF